MKDEKTQERKKILCDVYINIPTESEDLISHVKNKFSEKYVVGGFDRLYVTNKTEDFFYYHYSSLLNSDLSEDELEKTILSIIEQYSKSEYELLKTKIPPAAIETKYKGVKRFIDKARIDAFKCKKFISFIKPACEGDARKKKRYDGHGYLVWTKSERWLDLDSLQYGVGRIRSTDRFVPAPQNGCLAEIEYLQNEKRWDFFNTLKALLAFPFFLASLLICGTLLVSFFILSGVFCLFVALVTGLFKLFEILIRDIITVTCICIIAYLAYIVF